MFGNTSQVNGEGKVDARKGKSCHVSGAISLVNGDGIVAQALLCLSNQGLEE